MLTSVNTIIYTLSTCHSCIILDYKKEEKKNISKFSTNYYRSHFHNNLKKTQFKD